MSPSLEDVETEVRWLPYVYSEDRTVRFFVCGCKESGSGIVLCPYHLDMVDTVVEP